jgi:6-pyruvoyltetrahydropterin/6-carboxytetrahydropterin synthase
MTYQVIKRYGHEEGWSCTFRQHLATHSHCRFVHGYPLSFQFRFQCETLDDHNWVIDFGGFKELKEWLKSTFDHKMIIAADDPEMNFLLELKQRDLADVLVLPAVGCEKFAELAYKQAITILGDVISSRVKLVSVMVSEHFGNSAIYKASW